MGHQRITKPTLWLKWQKDEKGGRKKKSTFCWGDTVEVGLESGLDNLDTSKHTGSKSFGPDEIQIEPEVTVTTSMFEEKAERPVTQPTPSLFLSLSLSGGNTEYNAVKIVQWMWNLESGDGDRKKKRKQREFFFISTSSTWQNWHLVKGLSCVNVTTMWHWLKEMKVVNHPCRKVVTEY